MTSVSAQFGKNVVDARKAKGLSQEALADLANLDRSYLSRVERGLMRVTLEKAFDIATALDCHISDLLPN